MFFLLGLMEERIALAAAQKTVAQLKASFPETAIKGRQSATVPTVDLVRACRASWKAYSQQAYDAISNPSAASPAASWVVPADIDIAVWSRFQKEAPEDEVAAILFSLVLGVSDDDLAQGFETSVGTIRYRLGKGIRQLGLASRGQGKKATS